MTPTRTHRTTIDTECRHPGCHYTATVLDITVVNGEPVQRAMWCYRHRPDAPDPDTCYPLPGHSCSGCKEAT